MFIAICCKPDCDVMNFEIKPLKLNLSDQAVFPTWPKGCHKNLNVKFNSWVFSCA